MATLEQYIAEATNAYKPAQTAIQNQLGALDSNLATAQNTINRNYEQQQKQLESQRNQAAEASSMAAAGSGGTFGGQGNLARRKYYEQSFVPAQTQLQTNQTNELEKARQDYENQRTSLNSQLANLEAQAQQQALQQYWAAVEAEKQRAAQLQAQRESQASQNAYYKYLMDAMNKSGNSGYTLSTDKNMYGGYDWTDANGRAVKLASVAAAASGATSGEAFNKSLYQLAQQAANQGDYYSQLLADRIAKGARYKQDTNGDIRNNNFLQTLGLFQMY